jgi:phosphatidylglycerophosphatase GEP4
MHWDMSSLNISGTLNILRVLAQPGLCLPHATISTFNDLPVPLNRAFDRYSGSGKNGERDVDIKAVVLDKDDCFAKPGENEVFKDYNVSLYFHACHRFGCISLSSYLDKSTDPAFPST